MVVGIYKQTAKDIMTKRVETLRQRDTIHYALTVMAENDVSAIPVVSPDGKLMGIISQRDIIAEAREKDVEGSERVDAYNVLAFQGVMLDELTNERVQDMMSEKVVGVHPDDAVTQVADKMLEQSIHHLPVMNDDNEILGIISTMDILTGLRQATVDIASLKV